MPSRTVKVKVEYSAQLKKAIGHDREEVEIAAGATAQDVLREIADREGGDVRRFLIREDGRLSPTVLLCVNDEQVLWSTPRTLAKGDLVSLTTPIAGGCGT